MKLKRLLLVSAVIGAAVVVGVGAFRTHHPLRYAVRIDVIENLSEEAGADANGSVTVDTMLPVPSRLTLTYELPQGAEVSDVHSMADIHGKTLVFIPASCDTVQLLTFRLAAAPRLAAPRSSPTHRFALVRPVSVDPGTRMLGLSLSCGCVERLSGVTVELTSGAKLHLENVRVSHGKWCEKQCAWVVGEVAQTSGTTTDNAVVMTMEGRVPKGIDLLGATPLVTSVHVYGERVGGGSDTAAAPTLFQITGLNVENANGVEGEEVKVPKLVKTRSRWRVTL